MIYLVNYLDAYLYQRAFQIPSLKYAVYCLFKKHKDGLRERSFYANFVKISILYQPTFRISWKKSYENYFSYCYNL